MKQTDMTKGSVWKLVVKMSLPMVVAQVVNLLYTVVDRMFVGRIEGVGTVALGGVGVYLPIGIIIMAFALWIGTGGAPKAAIELGKGDRKQAEKYLGTCVVPLIALGAAMTTVLLLFGRQLLPLFGATEGNMSYALTYLRIIAIGVIFNTLTTGLNAFINTQGKTLIGMMSVLLGAVVNIVLDALFILGFHMGVEGAALATVIGQAVSCVWVVGFLLSKKSTLRIRKKDLKPELRLLGTIMALGTATFISTAIESVVTIVLNFVLKKYGAAALTGFATDGATLAISVSTIITMASSFILLPINGFTQGVQPVISYNYGAGRNDRVKKAIHASCIICTTYTALFCALIFVLPQVFAGLFSTDVEVIAIVCPLIRIYVSVMALMGIQTSLQQSFVARGMAGLSIGVALARKALYVPLLLLLPALASVASSVTAIYLAEPISDLFAVVVTVICYAATHKTLSTHQTAEL